MTGERDREACVDAVRPACSPSAAELRGSCTHNDAAYRGREERRWHSRRSPGIAGNAGRLWRLPRGSDRSPVPRCPPLFRCRLPHYSYLGAIQRMVSLGCITIEKQKSAGKSVLMPYSVQYYQRRAGNHLSAAAVSSIIVEY